MYEKQGRPDRARADYDRGLKIEPNDPWLRQAIGALNRTRGSSVIP
ncbi:MAG: tetratricopeptide repeat protein [Xanthobacteraceae bacterium]